MRREVVGLGAVGQPVADADGDLGERREHVELRQRERGDAVDADREAQRDEVEPAAAALAAGDGAELAAELAHALLRRARRSRSGTAPRRRASRTPSRRRATSSIRCGPIPKLTAAPAAIGLDDVTNGYVPWSRSSSVPCAPSNSTLSPSRSARSTSSDVSATYGREPLGVRQRTRATTSSTSNGSMLVHALEPDVLLARPRARPSRAGSSGRAGPARGSRCASPCPRTPARSRAGSCRSAASRAAARARRRARRATA